ncbi:30S ribosomal protein S20 [candidate division WWE3 bacterium]|nr:30S ribosomal protein S20 [candidate division WWE3 bacterium]MBT7350360.1 30S ribosomal protein S20 [candidate division WWE3 bacterium]
MANTQSAKKAIRGSEKKRQHNLFWKRRIRAAARNIINLSKEEKADAKLLNENLVVLQKILDKAAKKKVIHKNKANRLKSRYAKKVTAHESKPAKKETKSKATGTKSGKASTEASK